jgi:carbamoyl-phosphate synthase large subunit
MLHLRSRHISEISRHAIDSSLWPLGRPRGSELRILVTAAGGDISQAITRIIRRNYSDVFIAGSDVNLEPFAANLVDQFVVLPPAAHQEYMKELEWALKEFRIDLLIPVSEEEINKISNSSLKLTAQVLIVANNVVETFSDKYKTYLFLSRFGDLAPRSLLEFDEKLLHFPCLVKPRFGRGSNNVHICHDKFEVEFYGSRVKDPVFQELLTPRDMEITCGVFRSASGHTQVIQLHRKLSGGRTSWANVIKDESVGALCNLIAQEIGLVGSVNIQLIITDLGPKVFEINPRYSSTVEMRDILGFKDLVWGINNLLFGEEPVNYQPMTDSLVGKVDNILVFGNPDQ